MLVLLVAVAVDVVAEVVAAVVAWSMTCWPSTVWSSSPGRSRYLETSGARCRSAGSTTSPVARHLWLELVSRRRPGRAAAARDLRRSPQRVPSGGRQDGLGFDKACPILPALQPEAGELIGGAHPQGVVEIRRKVSEVAPFRVALQPAEHFTKEDTVELLRLGLRCHRDLWFPTVGEEARECGLAADPAQMVTDRSLDPALRALVTPQLAQEGALVRLQGLQVQSRGDPHLACEVMVEATHAGAATLANVIDGRGPDPVLEKAAQACGKDLLPPRPRGLGPDAVTHRAASYLS
jgi:hypothetical protein